MLGVPASAASAVARSLFLALHDTVLAAQTGYSCLLVEYGKEVDQALNHQNIHDGPDLHGAVRLEIF